jgi:hypothetical protein
MSTPRTRAAEARRELVTARPMPDEAPVTIATLWV